MPLREIGLLPGGYRITSLCSKILWNEEDIVLVSCPESDASFSHYAVSYPLFGKPRLSYVALRQWFSTGGYCTPTGTFGNLWRRFWLSQPGLVPLALSEWNTAKRPTMRKPNSHNKEYPAQNVSAMEAENPDLMLTALYCDHLFLCVSLQLACKSFPATGIVFCLWKYP